MDSTLIGDLFFKKLDGRHTGNSMFKYYAKVIGSFDYKRHPSPTQRDHANIIDYIILRQWAWDTWGPSYEFKYYMKISDAKDDQSIRKWRGASAVDESLKKLPLNAHWCFDNDSGREARIYLKGEEEKMWAELKWK